MHFHVGHKPDPASETLISKAFTINSQPAPSALVKQDSPGLPTMRYHRAISAENGVGTWGEPLQVITHLLRTLVEKPCITWRNGPGPSPDMTVPRSSLPFHVSFEMPFLSGLLWHSADQLTWQARYRPGTRNSGDLSVSQLQYCPVHSLTTGKFQCLLTGLYEA